MQSPSITNSLGVPHNNLHTLGSKGHLKTILLSSKAKNHSIVTQFYPTIRTQDLWCGSPCIHQEGSPCIHQEVLNWMQTLIAASFYTEWPVFASCVLDNSMLLLKTSKLSITVFKYTIGHLLLVVTEILLLAVFILVYHIVFCSVFFMHSWPNAGKLKQLLLHLVPFAKHKKFVPFAKHEKLVPTARHETSPVTFIVFENTASLKYALHIWVTSKSSHLMTMTPSSF